MFRSYYYFLELIYKQRYIFFRSIYVRNDIVHIYLGLY